jgi:hypothetical protein
MTRLSPYHSIYSFSNATIWVLKPDLSHSGISIFSKESALTQTVTFDGSILLLKLRFSSL